MRLIIIVIAHLLLTTAATGSEPAPAPPPVAATAAEAHPRAVGTPAPLDVAVATVAGAVTTLRQVQDGQPVVLVFYRGGWCPYCTRHLAALGEIVPQLTQSGWRIVAISPDAPETMRNQRGPAQEAHDGLVRLSDADGSAMRAFGVAFQVDAETVGKLAGHGIDLNAASGKDHRWLPVPSVFLIDGGGTIRFVHADPDHRQRLAPETLLGAAAEVRKADGKSPP